MNTNGSLNKETEKKTTIYQKTACLTVCCFLFM